MSDTRYHGRNAQWDTTAEAGTPGRRTDAVQSDDPLAELARLIDEDPFADFNRQRREPEVSGDPSHYGAPSAHGYDSLASQPTHHTHQGYTPHADEPAGPFDGHDHDATDIGRLYAELAAASERVEPRLEAPRYTSFPGPRSTPVPEPEAYGDEPFEPHQGDAGGLYGDHGYADEGHLADSWAEDPRYANMPGDSAYDPLYAETDPAFDQTGHFAPYEGEPVQEPKSNRRRAMMIAGGMVGLVVVGGAAVVGYGFLSGGDTDAPPPVIRAERAPVKIQPPSSGESDAAAAQSPGKLVYDRVGADSGSEERLVSREEAVADVGDRQVRRIDTNQDDGLRGATGEATSDDLPRRVRTVVVRPDGTIVGEVAPPQPAVPLQPAPLPGSDTPASPAETAQEAPTEDAAAATSSVEVPLPVPRPAELPRSAEAPRQPAAVATAPVATAPVAAPRPAGSGFVPPSAPQAGQPIPLQPSAVAALPAASAPPPAGAPAPAASAPSATPAPTTGSFPPGSYVVQVAASRNEQDARSTAASISQRYAAALGSYTPVVERADLGDRGIYYRVGLGPMSSQSDAGALCARLKSSGLDCFVRRN
jgi:hypothetical protein